MRTPKVFYWAMPLVILLAGCGFGSTSSSKTSKLIEAGCKSYQRSFQDNIQDGEFLKDFSELAILDPRYLELSKAAGTYFILQKTPSARLADSVKPSYAESLGFLYGFCHKYYK